MNDRYLYKAKGQTSDKWYTGFLTYMTECVAHISYKEKNGIRKTAICDASTICQCTGLPDKYKTVMYENDIVEIDGEEEIRVIKWDSGSARYTVETSSYVADFDNYYPNEMVVVGNVFDNPELLEVKNDR